MDNEQAEFERLERLMLEAKENQEKERMSQAIAEAEQKEANADGKMSNSTVANLPFDADEIVQ